MPEAISQDSVAAPLPIAHGWYLALYADELPPGGVQSLEYVGRKLVIFRTEDGQAALADAHCPHLGAHLGVGGKVIGSALRCPFHGWEWDYRGHCHSIPYSKVIPPSARLRMYPVVERNGAVWFWYHPKGTPPEFEVPVIPEWGSADYGVQWDRHTWSIRAHPQDILENGIDFPHVMTVHGFDAPSNVVSSFEGPLYRWGADTGKEIELLDKRRENFSFRVDTWGLGLSQVHYHGLFSVIFQIGQTPVDATMTRMSFSVLTRESDRADPQIAAALRRYVADNVRTLEQDFPIWANKVYREQPLLCAADGPIHAFRRWAAQFYERAV
ncbi:MAG: Rieske 2Fe-2S domain-containing protein [Proteobacteria bacterium]|nr:Rieske 2Fe-2S domain-containing protein [Pseudomonadota bacterium]